MVVLDEAAPLILDHTHDRPGKEASPLHGAGWGLESGCRHGKRKGFPLRHKLSILCAWGCWRHSAVAVAPSRSLQGRHARGRPTGFTPEALRSVGASLFLTHEPLGLRKGGAHWSMSGVDHFFVVVHDGMLATLIRATLVVERGSESLHVVSFMSVMPWMGAQAFRRRALEACHASKGASVVGAIWLAVHSLAPHDHLVESRLHVPYISSRMFLALPCKLGIVDVANRSTQEGAFAQNTSHP